VYSREKYEVKSGEIKTNDEIFKKVSEISKSNNKNIIPIIFSGDVTYISPLFFIKCGIK
jgi:hypothetical protein